MAHITTRALAERLKLAHHGADQPLRALLSYDALPDAPSSGGGLLICLERRALKVIVSASLSGEAERAGVSAVLCTPRCESALRVLGWGGPLGALLTCERDDQGRDVFHACLRLFNELFHELLNKRSHTLPPTSHSNIHPTALVDPSALIEEGAEVGPFVVVEANARVRRGAQLKAYAFVGEGAEVGEGATLEVRASLLAGCEVQARALIGPGAVVGAQGFGLDHRGLLPHLGRAVIGEGASVGALSAVDRATLGVTRVDAHAQLDNLVQVGHNAQVGEGAVLCAQVGLAGGAVIEARAQLGGQAGVGNRVVVGEGASVAAQSGVTKALKAGGRYSGHPAEPNTPRLRRELKLRRLAEEQSLLLVSPLASPLPSLIHPSATIDPSARLALDVEVGEGVVIGPGVTLKRGAVIGAHSRLDEGCVVEAYGVVGERTWLKAGCEVSSFAVVGARPQLKVSAEGQHKQLESNSPRFELECGPRAQFREGSTVSRGAPWLSAGAGVTRVGEGCLLMAYSHVGHDSQLSARCVLANQVSLAGHVEVGEGVTFGGHAAVHQFVKIGALAFIAANAMVSGDVPPYCLAAGDHATLRGLNVVGLRRAGVSAEARAQLKLAFHERVRGRSVAGGLSALTEAHIYRETMLFLAFIERSKRGLCRAHR